MGLTAFSPSIFGFGLSRLPSLGITGLCILRIRLGTLGIGLGDLDVRPGGLSVRSGSFGIRLTNLGGRLGDLGVSSLGSLRVSGSGNLRIRLHDPEAWTFCGNPRAWTLSGHLVASTLGTGLWDLGPKELGLGANGLNGLCLGLDGFGIVSLNLLQPLLVVFLGKAHVSQKLGVDLFQRHISL